jgi:VWFA-related protein
MMDKATNAILWPVALATLLFPLAYRSAAAQLRDHAPPGEIQAGEATFKLRAERNLVVVRVVVRDSNGKAVTGLRKEDFRLFDNGKAQTVSGFIVESPQAKSSPVPSRTASTWPSTNGIQGQNPTEPPDRFVALYFDDLHIPFEDAVYTREAAQKYLSESLQPTDRVALFTSSGHLWQDFTGDRGKLAGTLDRLQPRPMIGGTGRECPDISPYQAFVIVDREDKQAMQLALMDYIACRCGGDPQMCPGDHTLEIKSQAIQVLETNKFQSKYTLSNLENAVGNLAHMPGQRSIVLVSPGFLSGDLKFELSGVADKALRDHVVINTLDSRGLYAFTPGGDASTQSVMFASGAYVSLKSFFDLANLQATSAPLDDLAQETGGVFFENSNDYLGGFRRTGGLPEAAYVLTFSPENLKYNGSFHKLKVVLAGRSNLTIQARRGYYAPKKSEDLAARAKEDIEEAAFSRDEMRELPLDIRSSFYKTDNLNAEFRVLGHVDLSSVTFRVEGDRHCDNFSLVVALFDSDGNYVTGSEATYKLRLRDASFTQAMHNGIVLKTTVNVKPGTYFVRVVVRDSDSGQISAVNSSVVIPY